MKSTLKPQSTEPRVIAPLPENKGIVEDMQITLLNSKDLWRPVLQAATEAA